MNNRFLKILSLAFLCGSFVYAENKNEADNIIRSASEGRNVIFENQDKPEETKEEDEKIFYKEVILNWHYTLQKENKRMAEVLGKTTEDSLVKNVKATDIGANEDGKSDKKLAVVKGFCFITDEINVGKQAGALRADCQTNVGAVIVFGDLVNVDERASLILDAKYVEKNGYRYKVESSIVTNEEKTSYNIATYVNDRKFAQVGWETLSQGSSEVKTYTNQYLKALEQSKKTQQLAYTNMSSGTMSYPVSSTLTNTQAPDPLNYLAIAGTNIITSAIKATADVFKKDLPYKYQIVAKTKIWVDLQVEEEGVYVK